jgi:aldose 1-epimerase
MYRQTKAKFGLAEKILITNDKGSGFSVVPAIGANISKLELICAGKSYSLINGVDNYEEMIDDKAFKSSVLLPWPNRIKDGKFSFEGKTYQVDINESRLNNALHGFIFKKSFSVEKVILEPTFAEVFLSYSYDGSEAGFPFKFKTDIVYKISDDEGFSVSVGASNIDNKNVPMGIGWHPYFQLPSKINDIKLQLPKYQVYEIDEQMIPTGNKSDFNAFSTSKKIEDVTFDNCFGLVGNDKKSSTILMDEASGIALEFWQDRGTNGFDFLQIYTPPTRTTIAIEPMTCGVDVFNNGNGLLILKPGESFSGNFGVKLTKS